MPSTDTRERSTVLAILDAPAVQAEIQRVIARAMNRPGTGAARATDQIVAVIRGVYAALANQEETTDEH